MKILPLLFLLCTTHLLAQSLQIQTGAGFDYGYTYRAQEQPGWPFLRGRHALPLISIGLNKLTPTGNLRTLNYFLSAESDRLDSNNPVIGNAGKSVYYRNGLLCEIMFPLTNGRGRHQLFTGYAVSLAYGAFRFTPSSSVYFPQYRKEVMLEGGAALHYRYPLDNGIKLFGALNVNVIRTAVQRARVENPILTKEQQTTTLFEMDLGSRLFLRAGVCADITRNKQSFLTR